MSKKIKKEILNTVSKNPGNWRGPIYFNRKDYRLMVPKQNPSLGWTLNFASPYAYVILVAIILIAIAARYLFK
jgi:uncharacterized membrane protein